MLRKYDKKFKSNSFNIRTDNILLFLVNAWDVTSRSSLLNKLPSSIARDDLAQKRKEKKKTFISYISEYHHCGRILNAVTMTD